MKEKNDSVTPNSAQSLIIEGAISHPSLVKAENITAHYVYSSTLKGESALLGEKTIQGVDIQTLRSLLQDGASITRVEFDAVTFIQGKNSNHFRFYDRDMNVFAESFLNMPFLRNHDHNNIDSRDGTIFGSSNDNGQFKQRIALTTDRGISDFAQGRIDRFSIGWDYSGILCSLCENDYLSFSDCPHMIGHNYDGNLCEIFFENPRGIETSAVNVPAVQGTHILAQLNSKVNHFAKLEDNNFMDEQHDDLVNLDEHQEEEVVAQEDAPVLQQNEVGQSNNRLQVAAQAITPHVLATLLQDRGLQATFARAFFLDDMDERIRELERQLNEANEENARLASAVDVLNGQLLPGGNFYEFGHDQLAQSNWSGYQGSALERNRSQEQERRQPPPSTIRPVRQGRLNKKESNQKTKSSSRQNRRAEAGAEVLGLWSES